MLKTLSASIKRVCSSMIENNVFFVFNVSVLILVWNPYDGLHFQCPPKSFLYENESEMIRFPVSASLKSADSMSLADMVSFVECWCVSRFLQKRIVCIYASYSFPSVFCKKRLQGRYLASMSKKTPNTHFKLLIKERNPYTFLLVGLSFICAKRALMRFVFNFIADPEPVESTISWLSHADHVSTIFIFPSFKRISVYRLRRKYE